MSESQRAWKHTGEEFRALGERLRDKYKSQEHEAQAADDRDAIEKALRTLSDAIQRTVETVDGAVRAPDVRDQARKAARSLGDALKTTFSELDDEVRQRSKPDKAAPSESGEPASDRPGRPANGVERSPGSEDT
ncbi:MAG TPA: hypothetical protein VML96_01120 [Egibacteraceae bacterium]|nr:hypothetical protein [Egibacteraceae bacterium]